MFKRSSLVAVVTALTIGAASFAATAPAQAASSMGFAQLENSVGANLVEVGGHKGKKHGGHKGHHGKRHGKRHHGRHHGGGFHFGFYPGVYVGPQCFYKTFKEWDPYAGGWVIFKKQVCY
jgi:hypothetical protein